MDNAYNIVYIFIFICLILLYIFRKFVLEFKDDLTIIKHSFNGTNIYFYIFLLLIIAGHIFSGSICGIVFSLLGYFWAFVYFLSSKIEGKVFGLYTLYIIFAVGLLLTMSFFLLFIHFNVYVWQLCCLTVVVVWSMCLGKLIFLARKNDISLNDLTSFVFLILFMMFETYFFLGTLMEPDIFPKGRDLQGNFNYIVLSIGNAIHASNGLSISELNTKTIVICVIIGITNVVTSGGALGYFVSMLKKYTK